MPYAPQLLLIGAVAAVGVLHTAVPDHWMPIALVARQRGWSKRETVRAAMQAGLGHVLSTLAIAVVVWFAGVAFATRFGRAVDTATSLALIGFGGWFAVAGLREAWGATPSIPGAPHAHGALEAGGCDPAQAGDVAALANGARLDQRPQASTRTALLLILGSSPMVEGIPAFFAAGKYGTGLLAVMAVVFGLSTIAAYAVLCAYSTQALHHLKLGAIETYGEVLSGGLIVLLGCIFWFFPHL